MINILIPNLRGPVEGYSTALSMENMVWKAMAIMENTVAIKIFFVIFMMIK
jgi:hypothetical protein